MQGRDQSVIEHIFDYCKEIKEELEQIGQDKGKFIDSTVYKNSLALCVLQIGELVTLLSDDYKESKNSVEWKSIKGMTLMSSWRRKRRDQKSRLLFRHYQY